MRTTLILALLLLSDQFLQADSIPEIVERSKSAIVEIVSMDTQGPPRKLGTGFFVSSDGLVVTNFHVIRSAASLAAVSNNGALFLFEKIVAQPTGVDLAILRFRANDVPFLILGDSTNKVEGEKVIVIGNPTGFLGTLSEGIISGFRENRSLIQFTAPISYGSSGSPVMDQNGQVIGVATWLSGPGQNLNFAIAVEEVSAVGWPTKYSSPSQTRQIAHLSKQDQSKAIEKAIEKLRSKAGQRVGQFKVRALTRVAKHIAGPIRSSDGTN